MIKFEIIGDAVRVRHRSFKLPTGQIKRYLKEDVKNWKALVKLQDIQHKPDFLWDGPIGVRLRIHKLKPKSARKKDYFPLKKPDLEQLVKPILDAFTGVFYHDDSQIVFLEASKMFCLDTQPRIEVHIWRHPD